MPSFRDLLTADQGRRSARSTPPRPTSSRQRPSTVVLDVREPEEYEQGAIPGAMHIPRGHLESPDREPGHRQATPGRRPLRRRRPLRLRRQDARRARLHRRRLDGRRLQQVEGRGPRLADARALTPEQRNRYQRHLLLPEVGDEGQLKLLDAEGAAARRRRPRLARGDVPGRRRRGHDRHHRHGRRRRVEPAAPDPAQHRSDRRPQGRLGQEDAHRCSTPTSTSSPTTSASAPTTCIEILAGYDVVVDGADNFPSRYLLNDASVKLGIPVVHGSIFRFEGQVTVFDPHDGPTYRD